MCKTAIGHEIDERKSVDLFYVNILRLNKEEKGERIVVMNSKRDEDMGADHRRKRRRMVILLSSYQTLIKFRPKCSSRSE